MSLLTANKAVNKYKFAEIRRKGRIMWMVPTSSRKDRSEREIVAQREENEAGGGRGVSRCWK